MSSNQFNSSIYFDVCLSFQSFFTNFLNLIIIPVCSQLSTKKLQHLKKLDQGSLNLNPLIHSYYKSSLSFTNIKNSFSFYQKRATIFRKIDQYYVSFHDKIYESTYHLSFFIYNIFSNNFLNLIRFKNFSVMRKITFSEQCYDRHSTPIPLNKTQILFPINHLFSAFE